MSMRPYTMITIVQQPNDVFKIQRTKTFSLDFVNSGQVVSSWQNLTDTAKITLPRNIYILDESNNRINLGGQINGQGPTIYNNEHVINAVVNQVLQGQIIAVNAIDYPVIMRGDKIKIEVGIFFDQMNGQGEVLESNVIFEGYITKIKNRIPIELECEDEMWKIKQIPVVNKVWKSSDYTVQTMLTEMLAGKNITVIDRVTGSVQTNVGDFRTQNETVGDILNRLKTEGSIYSYMRGNELRCSGIVYYPQDRIECVFAFQENIINDDLEYQRKEDINVAIKAISQTITKSNSEFNKDNSPKQKNERLEVLVGKNGVIKKADWGNYKGSIVSLPFLGITTEEELIRQAELYLPKFYYTGFKGSFTTFGIPMVKHGYSAVLRDNILPERNGEYLIKSVITTFGTQSLRQKVLLHLRIDRGYTVEQLNSGL